MNVKVNAVLLKRFGKKAKCKSNAPIKRLDWDALTQIQRVLSCPDKVKELMNAHENWGRGRKNEYSTKHSLFEQELYVNLVKRMTKGKPRKTGVVRKQILDSDSQVAVIGDIHSDVLSLVIILQDLRKKGWFVDDSFKLNDTKYILFAGDLTDYGPFNMEVLLIALNLLYANYKDENYKETDPHVILCRGNHETYNYVMCKSCNLFKEITVKTGIEKPRETLRKLLSPLLTAWFFKFKDDEKWIQCNHGGIPTRKKCIENLRTFLNRKKNRSTKMTMRNETDVFRFLRGDFGLKNKVCEITGRPQSDRDAVQKYFDETGIGLILGGHQDLAWLLTFPSDENNENNKNSRKEYPGLKAYSLPTKRHMPIDLDGVMSIITSTAIVKMGEGSDLGSSPVTYLLIRSATPKK